MKFSTDSIAKVKPLIHIYITRAIQVEDCTLPALAQSYGRICASVVGKSLNVFWSVWFWVCIYIKQQANW